MLVASVIAGCEPMTQPRTGDGNRTFEITTQDWELDLNHETRIGDDTLPGPDIWRERSETHQIWRLATRGGQTSLSLIGGEPEIGPRDYVGESNVSGDPPATMVSVGSGDEIHLRCARKDVALHDRDDDLPWCGSHSGSDGWQQPGHSTSVIECAPDTSGTAPDDQSYVLDVDLFDDLDHFDFGAELIERVVIDCAIADDSWSFRGLRSQR